MKNTLTKFLILFVCTLLLFTCFSCFDSSTTNNTYKNYITLKTTTHSGELNGRTVILHTNDVHGAVTGYSYIPTLKAEYEAKGANVIVVDDGDFTNGNIYVSISKGLSAATLMEAAGYDIVSLGNHELDFNYDNLSSNLKDRSYKVICSNVYKDGQTIFQENVVVKIGDINVGFFGLLTPQTQTKVNPSYVKDFEFSENDELYKVAQKEIDELRKYSDVVICLAHLGVDPESEPYTSYDVFNNVTGLDFIIDGHSHTVMEKGEKNEPIQSTGTAFENIGVIVIDNYTKKIVANYLRETNGELNKITPDKDVYALAKNVVDTVDAEFGATFAQTSVDLIGEKANVRSEETNLGDLVCDSMLWTVLNEGNLKVDNDHVIAVTNGGGIRASIPTGDISRSAVKTVLPFGNTIAVTYVKGSDLLESLEASTYCSPTTIGGFPQIAGMKIRIDTTKEFDQGELYPDSTYYGPKSINRVTILEINGKPFNANDTYAVVTNNFCAIGGDTYYAYKAASDAGNTFDTSIPLDEGLVNYIMYVLKCEIGEQYSIPQGRIEIIK